MFSKYFEKLASTNMRKTGSKRYFYDYIVDYNVIVVADILDIHKYLMKKNGIV